MSIKVQCGCPDGTGPGHWVGSQEAFHCSRFRGLKMQIGRTKNANAKKTAKECNLRGKKGVREKKGRSKWFKCFFRPLRRRFKPFFSRHFISARKKAEKCKKGQKMQHTKEKSPFRKNAKNETTQQTNAKWPLKGNKIRLHI